MRLLVTGHKGYIGTRLVPLLLDHGHDVTGLDTDLFRACTYLGTVADVPEIDTDIRDVDESQLADFDAVIHLAALSNDPLGDYDPSLTRSINHEASVNLARLAKRAGVQRFLFASSCSTYGASGDDFLDERARFNPVTPYGQSKVDAERDISPLADDSFSPTFLRASTAYGVSPRLRFDLVVNNLTAWAFTTGEVHLKSDGTPWRPVVHIEDIGRAYVAVLESPRDRIHNKAFNVGQTSENYQISQLAEFVRDVVPGSKITFASGAAPDLRCYRVDCNLIAKTLPNFKPQWTARRGVEEVYDSIQRRGLTLEEFEGDRFMRIAHMKMLIREQRIDGSLRWVANPRTQRSS